MPENFSSLTAALGSWAEKKPDHTAYIFLAEGEEEQDRLTYAALDARARAIAAALRRSFRPGERALLLYPPGLDFIAAFFGCLYAGVIAVPVYPPRSPRMMPRLLAILGDAQPALVMAPAASLERVRAWLERMPDAVTLPWLATDEVEPAPPDWKPAAPEGDAIAFLQYTSGSTSTPKGVMVTQANLAHNLQVIQKACSHSEESVFVSWLPLYHDLGLIGNLLQATWVGAPCVLMAPIAFLQNPSRWLRAISRYRGTTSGGPNFAYDLCLRRVPPTEVDRLDLSSWRVAFNGAEPVRAGTLARFAETFAPAGFRACALYPCYGLAEATLMVSGGYPGEEPVVREIGGRRLVGCGRALSDLEVAIVDPESRRSLPPGAVGEIWVAGDSVARGYWNRPEETARAFGATVEGGDVPWLRTGDLGVLDGGELFVAGRLKDLMILRGRNHYPEDIEATARAAHPALGDGTGAAFAVNLDDEERLVIVHEVERHAAHLPEIAAAVRQAIAEEHEVLAWEVVLVPTGGVPRTTSGKVQRRACRDLYSGGELRILDVSRLAAAAVDEDPVESALPGSLDWLRRVFAAVARIEPASVDPDRPLSASGLDSLAAVELKHRVEEATGVSLPLPDLLEGMTLRDVERRVAEGAPAERVGTHSDEAMDATGEHPLSWNQRSLWFLHRLAPESPAYNIAGAARLHGADPTALGRAFQGLVDRHPMLRATFVDTPEGPVQRVAERAEAAFVAVDATDWSDEEIHRRLHAEAFRPFDLTVGPLLRAALLRRKDEAFLSLAVHHIAADFWSMTTLARELGALSAGQAPPSPRALYTDFVRQQHRSLQSPAGERLWEHWRERLAGIPQLDLPTDRPRRPVSTLRGGSRTLPPSPERREAVHRLAAAHGCTPFVVLLAAWEAVLGRWSHQEEFLLGAPMSGRSGRSWEDVVGYFVNPVALRADLTADLSVRELVARARGTALDALAHQDLPFALLTERLQPERDPSRPPLLSALLTFEKAPVPELAALAAFPVSVPGVRLDLGGMSLESLSLDPPAVQLDLSLLAAELAGGLSLFLQWDADLFDDTTAERMLDHLDRVLAGMADSNRPVWELPLLGEAESRTIFQEWSSTGWAPPAPALIHELFAEQAARTPDKVAAVCQDESVTYQELAARAGGLARFLRRLDGRGGLVGLMAEPDHPLLTGILGILEAGSGFVPFDPDSPAERLARMVGDCGLTVLATDRRHLTLAEDVARRCPHVAHLICLDGRSGLDIREPVSPAAGPAGDGTAYLIFTSGSTGAPKGVPITHENVVPLLLWSREIFGFGERTRVLQSLSHTFDFGVFEILTTLLFGGTLFLRDGAARSDVEGSLQDVRRHAIDTLHATPSYFRALAAVARTAGEGLSTLRVLHLGGEALDEELVEQALAITGKGCRVFNGYGPTEAAVNCALFEVARAANGRSRGTSSVPIGRPSAANRLYVLDRRLQPVPVGMTGELAVGGPGLASGYLRRPELTAERFLPDTFGRSAGGRIYRTGDLARYRPDGELEVLGRIDQQVKIRGFRVELGEIEAALAERSGVASAAVVVEATGAGKRLVACVVPAEPEAEPARLRERLREELRDRLPAFMVPSRFAVLDALPLSSNGKVDRRALVERLRTLPDDSEAQAFEPPQGGVEECLAAIWSALLGRERVDRRDNFFTLGGHSLLAVHLATRVRDAFGVELPVRTLFEHPTVAELAAAVEASRGGAAPPAPPLVRVPRTGPLPLSFAQQRLWFIDQLEPGSPLYNLAGALRVTAPLDAAVLARSLGEIVRRHEALRTAFPAQDGEPVQVIQPAGAFDLPWIDLSGLPEGGRETAAAALRSDEAGRPFDLSRGPLLRGLLLRLSPRDHLLTLTLHHIASDGWSVNLLVRELAALVAAFSGNRPSPLPELPVQYADFAVWQRSWLQGEILEREIAFWREQLAGLPPLLNLPTDRPRPAVQSYRGTTHPVRLPVGLVRQMETLARREGATLFMVLLAAFQALLARYSGQDLLAVGSPVAGRNRLEIEELIGFFANTLVLRGDLSGDPSFRGLLSQVRETLLDAWRHQDVPFERLVQELAPERSLGHAPLFQALLVLQGAPLESLEIGELLRPPDGAGATAKFDLALSFEPASEGLAGFAESAADLFDPGTIEHLLGHLACLLASGVAAPETPVSELRLLDTEEEDQLVRSGRAAGGRTWALPATVHELFWRQAARSPDQSAAAGPQEALTYGRLAEQAAALAERIRSVLSLPLDRPVALLSKADPLVLAGMLGILRAGGAFVPLDPRHPDERLAWTLQDAACEVMVTRRRHREQAARLGVRHVLYLEDDALAAAPGSATGAEGEPRALSYIVYTSGSTGRPKGVQVSHESLVTMLLWGVETFGLGAATRVLQNLSFCFDFGIFEHLTTLLAGGTLVFPGESAGDPPAFAREIVRQGIDTLHTTPAFALELAAAEVALDSLEVLHLGGEALSQGTVARLRPSAPRAAIYNGYGPTEATVNSSLFAVEGDSPWPGVPIGRPSADNVLYVLDRGGRLVPRGVRGELHVGGIGVARGYLNRPDLTAERFVPDPFGGVSGGRIYRTGDLVRPLPGGDLEFLGRMDQQVKIRGFRIELGEIEAALLSHPEVREASVLALPASGGQRLVACVAPATVPVGELRQSLGTRLPGFMVPSAFLPLPGLPLTAHGKVDRRALERLAPAAVLEGSGEYVAPRSAVEEMLALLWAEVLGVERVGADEDFFTLGGHSLLAVRLASRVRDAFGVELPVRTLFEHPTVAELGAAVEAARGGTSLLAPPLVRVPRTGPLPLSFAQERLWFLDRLEPGNPAYNVPLALRLRGPVSAPALAAALAGIAARHEPLRATFSEAAGQPAQEISPAPRFPLALIDLTRHPAATRPAEAARLAAEEARRPFDLAAGPLCRAALLRLTSDEHLCVLSVHHIAFDGGSAEVLLRELGQLYTGTPLPPLPVQYGDFALWQRAWLDGGALAAQLDAWRERLAGAPASLDLPADRRRPAVQTFRGGVEPVRLPAELVHGLRTFGRRRGAATLFMSVLAGWSALLHRSSGAAEVVVGTPVANRRRPELEGLIGLFVNTLPLRVDLGGDPPFEELVDRVRGTALAAYENQDVPFERLVEAAGAERSLSRSPLFQVMLALADGAAPALHLPEVTAEEVPLHNGTAKFELLLALNSLDGSLSGGLEFNTDLFDAATARRLAERLVRLLAGAAAAPHLCVGDLPLLDPAEERQILVEWNATEAPFPRDLGLHELFEAQAARTPRATALIHGERRVTYAELNAWADRLARRLRSLGVGPEVLVGVFSGRTPGMVAAALAVLKAGGAYLPLDPAYPADRLSYLLADSGASVVLAAADVAEALPAFTGALVLLEEDAGHPEEVERPRGFLHPDQAAYAIYTSGSTGLPKGVMIRHGSAVARITWALSAYPREVLAGVLAATSLCFDLSVFEVFVPLAAGGAVILADDALALPRLPAASAVTLVNTVPSVLTELVHTDGLPRSVRVINLAGEPLRRDLVARLYTLDQVEEVHNLYGPSEDTTYSTGARIERTDEREPSIGRPLPNSRAYLLDSGLRPVPVGAPGELWLGGVGVARGYLHRPDLTADRFRPDPFGPVSGDGGGRLYRTGDLARRRMDGDLDFLGRIDHQVKVRGFRIELGEIEAALLAHPGVREAAVVVRERAGASVLVAYVVAGEAPPAAAELRGHLRRRLPEPMVPAFFVSLPRLPLTLNGKVDRRMLPDPEREASPAEQAAPRTPVEEVLAGIWAEVLGLERVGIHESFFELGGHSLLATRVLSRLRSVLGVELPVRALFERPSVAELSAAVDEARLSGAGMAAPPRVAEPRPGTLPLSFAQERLWFLAQLGTGSPAYHLATALELQGDLREDALAAALAALVARHEALRTTFARVGGGGQAQVVHPFAGQPLPVVDLEALPATRREAEARRLADDEAGRPFHFERGPLLRALLLRTAAREHILALTLHHLIADGWSMEVLVREVTVAYAALARGERPVLPELPMQYADFAIWQRRWLHGETLERQLDYWRRSLEGVPAALELPTDHPRPPVQTSRGAQQTIRLDPGLSTALAVMSRRQGATLFMTLVASTAVLLSRWAGQPDIVLGTPIANRTWAEIENLIGLVANTLALRIRVAGETGFSSLLAEVRQTALAAYAHQDLPFEKLVDDLQIVRSSDRAPLFQVLVGLWRTPLSGLDLPGVHARQIELDSGTAKFDLTLRFEDREDSLGVQAEYATDLFEAVTIRRLLAHLQILLAGAVAAPECRLAELPLLSAGERQQLLVEWNDTARPVAPGCLHELFEQQAARSPEALAVEAGGERLTWRQLSARSDRLARSLRRHGVAVETRVGLCLPRSVDQIVAILGVLKAGGAFVPLDPASPRERLQAILAEAGATVVVTAESLRERLPADCTAFLAGPESEEGADLPDTLPRPHVGPGNLAYILYTSGSTGSPKGVMIEHRSVVSLAAALREAVYREAGAPLRVAVNAPLVFDASVKQWVQLLSGHSLHIVPDEVRPDPDRMLQLLREQGVQVLDCTPSQLSYLLAAGLLQQPGSLECVLVGGEALSRADWSLLAGSGRPVFYNIYGPTECTVDATSAEVRSAGSRPVLGRPIANARIYLLDPALHPVLPGASGELCIGGAGVARGYLGHPAQTAERFVPDPWSSVPGERIYRTGDLARQSGDGTLEYLGRRDHQVKLHGFRIELGEIEAVLGEHPDVRSVAVLLRTDELGEQRLAAYVACPGEPAPSAGDLRSHLKRKLPDYMIPAAFMILPELPRTRNGKIDRTALTALGLPARERESGAAPDTPLEKALSGMMAEVLGLEWVGLDDNFFELGGHSMLAVELVGRLQDAFGIDLPLFHVFDAPTVAGLAAVLLESPEWSQTVEELAPAFLQLMGQGELSGMAQEEEH